MWFVGHARGSSPLPLTLKVRRGGPEPWSLERDGSGLSVDEMVRAAAGSYGKLIDAEKEEALRLAFAEIKEVCTPPSARARRWFACRTAASSELFCSAARDTAAMDAIQCHAERSRIP